MQRKNISNVLYLISAELFQRVCFFKADGSNKLIIRHSILYYSNIFCIAIADSCEIVRFRHETWI